MKLRTFRAVGDGGPCAGVRLTEISHYEHYPSTLISPTNARTLLALVEITRIYKHYEKW